VNISDPLEASDPQHGSTAFRWLTMVVLLTAVVVAVIFVSVGRADAASCSGPLAGGEIRVVIVVDGTDIGSGSSATCLVVPAGTSGSQLLARRSAELGAGSPRYGSSGLLCAIDGLPATGCGDRNADGFGYWAYFFEADGKWFYGNGNPFTKRLVDGAIEGWRFVTGGCGCGLDPPPRIGPSRSLFPALAPAVPPLPEPSLPLDGGAPVVTKPGSPVGGNPAGSVTSGSEPASADSGTVESASPSSTVAPVAPLAVDDVALASSSTDRSTTGRWVAIVVVALVVAAFAGGAWRQARRSP
jgi:hypothetical protein